MKTALIVLLIIFGVLLLILFAACGLIFNQLVWRKTVPVPKFILKFIAGNEEPCKFDIEHKKALESFEKMKLEKVTLTAPDGAELAGHVLLPEESNGRLILACHGARSAGLAEFCFMADYFYKNGYTVVLPDHRGCGDSSGKFMGYGTHESVDSFLWLDYAKDAFPSFRYFCSAFPWAAQPC